MECGCYDFGSFLCTEDVSVQLEPVFIDGSTQMEAYVMLSSTNYKKSFYVIITKDEPTIIPGPLNESNVYTFQLFDPLGEKIIMVTDQGEADEKEWGCFTFQTVIAHVRS